MISHTYMVTGYIWMYVHMAIWVNETTKHSIWVVVLSWSKQARAVHITSRVLWMAGMTVQPAAPVAHRAGGLGPELAWQLTMIPEQTVIINIRSISPLPSPSPPTLSQYYETEWTLWDRFVVDGRRDGSEMTVQELYDYFEVCDRLPCVCVCVCAWVRLSFSHWGIHLLFLWECKWCTGHMTGWSIILPIHLECSVCVRTGYWESECIVIP